ncbi:MAG: FAD-dependent oxidoreductase, partial [Planctomycetota bacterium]
MKPTPRLAPILVAMSLFAFGPRSEAASVSESARELPMAYDVDVVIVGGSTGASAAAVAAAERGAKVFLAAPRPYLGEDMCGTLRLWLEPGEEPTSPLAKELYRSAAAPPVVREGLPFSYRADLPSAGVHKDTRKPSRLTDGRWGRSNTESVQYDGNVTVTADLGAERRFRSVHALVFQRDDDFEVKEVDVSASSDKRNWKQITVITNEKLGKGSF